MPSLGEYIEPGPLGQAVANASDSCPPALIEREARFLGCHGKGGAINISISCQELGGVSLDLQRQQPSEQVLTAAGVDYHACSNFALICDHAAYPPAVHGQRPNLLLRHDDTATPRTSDKQCVEIRPPDLQAPAGST